VVYICTCVHSVLMELLEAELHEHYKFIFKTVNTDQLVKYFQQSVLNVEFEIMMKFSINTQYMFIM
jgi:hypothetical protein